MIKKFENFNQKEEVTIEMCDELVFYTSCSVYYITNGEYTLFGFDELLFYNNDYSELKEASKKLFKLSKEDNEVKEAVLSLIEEQRKLYPKLIKFHDLEDLFLEQIDDGFSFNLNKEDGRLYIKIHKEEVSDYNNFSTYTSDIVSQNTSRGLKLSKSTFYNLENGKSIWSIHFFIKL